MRWGTPKDIVGDRKCIESECGNYIVTRYIPDDESPYRVAFLNGCHWMLIGEDKDMKDAIKIACKHYQDLFTVDNNTHCVKVC